MAAKEPSVMDVVELLKCSSKQCNKDMEDFNNYKKKNYQKLAILFKQQKESKNKKLIDNFNKERKRITNEINNHEENLKLIKCRITNCNNYIRNTLIFGINFQLKVKKDEKSKAMLNKYLKLFNKDTINPNDVKNYYNELGTIYS